MGKGMTLRAKTLIVFVLTLVLLRVPQVSAAVQVAATPQTLDVQAIDTYLESKLRQYRIPGLAIAIIKGDRIVHMKGFGVADLEKRSVTADTSFILGSVSKSFTALAIAQLVDEGKVNLDAPVRQYLPWFSLADRQAASQFTVRHLLNQISGISTWTGLEQLTDDDTSAGALEKHVRNLKTASLSQPVGKKFQYSNANYTILGAIVQTVSGMSYEEYIQQHIFTPLEMQHSYTSQDRAQQATPALSVGHRFWFGQPVATEIPYNRGDLPAGYLISSAEDMAHYLISHLNDGRYKDVTLVSSVSMTELHQPAVKVDGSAVQIEGNVSYAMGWFVFSLNGLPILNHAGQIANYSTNMTLIPSEKWGVALLTNIYPGVTGNSIRQLYKGVINLLVNRPPPAMKNHLLTDLQVIALPILLVLQLLGIFRAFIMLRRWHTRSKPTHLGTKSWLRHIGLPLVADGAIAAGLLIGLPILFDTPLPVMLFFQPDLIGIAVISGTLALIGGLVRTGFSLQALLKTSP
jgi:CubicO group peptidase (beta-lactamase class C family)